MLALGCLTYELGGLMVIAIILDKLIYVAICIAVFVIFKRASKDTLKSFFWTLTAGITLFLFTLFSEFTSTNGQLFLKKVTGIAPSEGSEILFAFLAIIIPIIWLILFIIKLKKEGRANSAST